MGTQDVRQYNYLDYVRMEFPVLLQVFFLYLSVFKSVELTKCEIVYLSFSCPHCNPLQGKYRFFTGNSLCSISTLTCFGSVQGLKGANFIEIQGNICILYRNIALDSYIHVYVLITGISLLFEKQQHRILEKQGKPCK